MTAGKPLRPDYPELTVRSRAAWRRWLQKHHSSSRGVWFVHFRKESGEKSVTYDDLVEEALCVGWIDSTIRKLDDMRYAHLVTPRNNPGAWSELNKRPMKSLIAADLMTAAGLAVYKPASALKASAHVALPVAIPAFFARALRANPQARRHFDALARTYKRHYIDWLANAKRDDTRARRLAEALRLLKDGRKLGMK
jgi:uncharacterized protein YdeI (YjbR/CyaY-like superfamily)